MKHTIDFEVGGYENKIWSSVIRIEFNSKSKDDDKLMKRACKELKKEMGNKEYTIYYWWWHHSGVEE